MLACSAFEDIRILMNEVGGGSCCYIPRQINVAVHSSTKYVFPFCLWSLSVTSGSGNFFSEGVIRKLIKIIFLIN